MQAKKTKLPSYFKPLFWGYVFDDFDPVKHKRLIIVNTLNHGDLKHWIWLIKTYGEDNLRKTIEGIPKSEFYKPAIPLIKIFFGVQKFKYASRGVQIKAERNIK